MEEGSWDERDDEEKHQGRLDSMAALCGTGAKGTSLFCPELLVSCQ
jgi:hypothetical protein